MKVEIFEVFLIGIIIFIQFVVFFRTRRQIRIFRNIIPKTEELSVAKIRLFLVDLERFSPRVILENIGKFQGKYQGASGIHLEAADSGEPETAHPTASLFEDDESQSQGNSLPKTQINIIDSKAEANPIFTNILFSLNNYLIRNRGASSDFSLIKDIVERNVSAVEEDINLSISVPLYLGLMGTMLGIVIGLFSMPDMAGVIDTETNNLLLNDGISSLIGGVKIAMIASFTGLALTIINSGGSFKGSRTLVEARKNEFYTFVQVELLPIINQGLAATLESLQRNLMKFNGEFTANLKDLSGIFASNTKTVLAQRDLLDSIDKMKVSEMTQYNLTVLQQLEQSVKQFEKFNGSMMNVNAFVTNSERIVDRTNQLLERTENFKSIADNLNNKLSQSQQLMEFLQAHFANLEQHKSFTANAVADVGHAISGSFKDLEQHILNSSEAVKQFTVDETESLRLALSGSQNSLHNLKHLSTITQEVSQFKDSSASQSESTRQRLDELNSKMAALLELMAKTEKDRANRKLGARFKRLISGK
ncbi:hypothetical protein [Persicitalea jodogahamensis]|uniref:MotA/TolQ/ExbB proton channel domain-containing protein n=1 Tax=Persicitalea jodogahamensis TaxID=402147 RepID=A0A8J3D207_9BACT|nr:hypothetical protein [Persicitalea jodogahamensis]GHB67214.1 hypothetical protein GCM10007390_20640 [Persicitalea jodogahamensis]